MQQCTENTHAYKAGFAPTTSWTVTEGSSLVDIAGQSNIAEFKITNGLVISTSNIIRRSKFQYYYKKVWIGPSSFYITQTHTNINMRVSLYLQSTNPLNTFEDMGFYPYNVSWYRPGNNITKQADSHMHLQKILCLWMA